LWREGWNRWIKSEKRRERKMWIMSEGKLINLSNIESLYIDSYNLVVIDDNESAESPISIGKGLGGYFIKGLAKVLKNNPEEKAVYTVEEIIAIGKEEAKDG
jgi:hypothetical protein